MRCAVCRKRLPEAAKFCAYCGASLPAAPTALPPVDINWSTARRALLALLLSLPASLLFWYLVGLSMQWTLAQSVTVGGFLSGLAGPASALLQARVFWPLRYRPGLMRSSTRLPILYGVGGGLVLVAGGAPIGLVVLLLAWPVRPPGVEAMIAGAFAGFISLRVGVPLAVVAGALTGWLVARFSRRLRGALGLALAAGLAWVNAGAVGGAIIGLLVSARVDLAPGQGAYTGALMQTALAGLLLPLGVIAARRLVILWFNRP